MTTKSLTAPAIFGTGFKYLILALLGAWMLLPFFWVFSASLMTSAEVTRQPPPLLASAPQWHNYADVMKAVPLLRAYINSLLVSTLQVAGSLFLSSLCGFGFAKYEFPGRDLLFMLVLGTMMIPFFVTLIPMFYIVKQFGWLNNYAGLIIPGLVSAYNIFMMRQFIVSIPDELLDAARIDGASEFRIFWQIVLPHTGPALATLGTFNFVGAWNAFLWPLLVVQSRSLFTVPLALNSLRTYGMEAQFQHLQMAGTAISVVPAVIIFLALQRYFVRGIALTGLKG